MDPLAEFGVEAEPITFSPDRDGIDDTVALRYRLRAPASAVRVRIFDSHGRPVRSLTEGTLGGREGIVRWDGFGDARRQLAIGIYIVFFEAVDAEGGTSEAYKVPVVLARPLGS